VSGLVQCESGPFFGLPTHTCHEIRRQIDARSGGEIRRGVFKSKCQTETVAKRPGISKLRLPKPGNRIQPFEVDVHWVGLRIGEGRPGLAEEPAIRLNVGVTQTLTVVATRKVGLDERPHPTERRRPAHVHIHPGWVAMYLTRDPSPAS
jgi:hypothetical protein